MDKIAYLGSLAVLLGTVAVACGSESVGGELPDDAGAPPATTESDGGSTEPKAAESYVIGGQVTGLLGTGLVLQNNGGDDLTVNANGTFVFKTKIEEGKPFAVTVKNQPTAPSQTCTVSGGTGTVKSANVTTVVVNCSTKKLTVGGTVSGLAGTGLVLQNNAGDDVTIGADGTFSFPKPIADGQSYSVSVKTQPKNLSQTCTVTKGAGTVAGANVTDVAVACVTDKFTVGGTVSGLVGTGLVLRNNGGGDLAITGNGSFTFTAAQEDGTDFAVTVATDPSGPQQTCVVSGGTGTIAGGNVSSVTVNCSTKKYAIGGSVSGLQGSGLVLTNNNGNDLPITANGTFAFSTPLDDLAAYAVKVKTQPTNKWQTCDAVNGTGTVAQAPVTSVAIVCTTRLFKVRATVTGLAGTGLVLQNNGGDDLPITANGSFEFATSIESGKGYLVSTLTNPKNKSQTCTVTNGTGTVAGTPVDVQVACVTNKYTVGGNVVGLAPGKSVVLENNAGDPLTVSANGQFTFPTAIESGQSFAVTVKTSPTTPNQTCTVTGGTGTVTAGNVMSVSVNCTTNMYTAGGQITGLDGTGLVLSNNGTELPINANGTFAMPPQADETGYDITVKTQPTAKSQKCTVTNGSGTIHGANVGTVSVDCVTNKYKVGGTVTGLAGGSVVLTNNGGDDLTVSADGGFLFNTPIPSGSSYAIAVKSAPAGFTCTVTKNATGTMPDGELTTVAVSCASGTCAQVNGTLWCKDANPGHPCNFFCSALGFGNPTISNADWFAAQDTVEECSAIASAFGIGNVFVNSYSYACAEALSHGGTTDLLCSTDPKCPGAHRQTSDIFGQTAVCPCVTSRVCGTANENADVTITCRPGTTIATIDYASYGTPTGSCGSFADSACDAATSQAVVEAACLGQASCTVNASNDLFGDPCSGTGKRLYVQATCQ